MGSCGKLKPLIELARSGVPTVRRAAVAALSRFQEVACAPKIQQEALRALRMIQDLPIPPISVSTAPPARLTDSVASDRGDEYHVPTIPPDTGTSTCSLTPSSSPAFSPSHSAYGAKLPLDSSHTGDGGSGENLSHIASMVRSISRKLSKLAPHEPYPRGAHRNSARSDLSPSPMDSMGLDFQDFDVISVLDSSFQRV